MRLLTADIKKGNSGSGNTMRGRATNIFSKMATKGGEMLVPVSLTEERGHVNTLRLSQIPGQ